MATLTLFPLHRSCPAAAAPVCLCGAAPRQEGPQNPPPRCAMGSAEFVWLPWWPGTCRGQAGSLHVSPNGSPGPVPVPHRSWGGQPGVQHLVLGPEHAGGQSRGLNAFIKNTRVQTTWPRWLSPPLHPAGGDFPGAQPSLLICAPLHGQDCDQPHTNKPTFGYKDEWHWVFVGCTRAWLSLACPGTEQGTGQGKGQGSHFHPPTHTRCHLIILKGGK